jgi:molybdate transport system ATP-binding protein
MTGLTATLRVRRGQFALDAEFAVPAGGVLGVIGPNGAGKSTLLLALAGAIGLDEGAVAIDGVEVDAAPERRGVGVVFQDALLFPHLSVLDNVAFGPRERGQTRAAARALARSWLDRLGIAPLAHRRPGGLSGGEAQRVALARALAVAPRLLLLDEPLAALDVEVRDAVRADLAAHVHDFGGVTVVVAHDREDVAALAEQVLVIEAGRVVQRGTLAELTAAPATEFVRRFTAGTSPSGAA